MSGSARAVGADISAYAKIRLRIMRANACQIVERARQARERSAFLDRVDAVGIKGEMILDLGHRRKRLLVAPHRVVGAAAAGGDREIAGVALVGAIAAVGGRREQRSCRRRRAEYSAPADSPPPAASAPASCRRSPCRRSVTRTRLPLRAMVIGWSGPGSFMRCLALDLTPR